MDVYFEIYFSAHKRQNSKNTKQVRIKLLDPKLKVFSKKLDYTENWKLNVLRPLVIFVLINYWAMDRNVGSNGPPCPAQTSWETFLKFLSQPRAMPAHRHAAIPGLTRLATRCRHRANFGLTLIGRKWKYVSFKLVTIGFRTKGCKSITTNV